jgi:hypothetical protein
MKRQKKLTKKLRAPDADKYYLVTEILVIFYLSYYEVDGCLLLACQLKSYYTEVACCLSTYCLKYIPKLNRADCE